jgi:hypothetical protein
MPTVRDGPKATCVPTRPTPVMFTPRRPCSFVSSQRTPGSVPTTIGWNLTVIVQLDPAASDFPHVPVTMSYPMWFVVTDALSPVSGADEPFWSVTTFVAAVYSSTSPKSTGSGDSETALPAPDTANPWPPASASSLMVKVPELGPTAVGENLTWIAQDAPDASDPPVQSSDATLKSLPVVLTELTVRPSDPVDVMVTTRSVEPPATTVPMYSGGG